MNLSGLKERYTAHIESLRAVFGGPIRLVPVDGDDNVLLFAFRGPHAAELPRGSGTPGELSGTRAGAGVFRHLDRLRAGEFLPAQ